jgi:hypothetical protein
VTYSDGVRRAVGSAKDHLNANARRDQPPEQRVTGQDVAYSLYCAPTSTNRPARQGPWRGPTIPPAPSLASLRIWRQVRSLAAGREHAIGNVHCWGINAYPDQSLRAGGCPQSTSDGAESAHCQKVATATTGAQRQWRRSNAGDSTALGRSSTASAGSSPDPLQQLLQTAGKVVWVVK